MGGSQVVVSMHGRDSSVGSKVFVPLLGVVERVTFKGIGTVDVMRQYRPGSQGVVSDSFTSFYRREWRDVVGLGFVLTGDRWVAEELAQEGFASACRKWDRVGAMDRPGAWVRRVVVNQSVSRLRRRGVERRAFARMVTPGASPDLTVDARSAEVWAAVRALPKRQGQVIALVYFDGMTVPEASQVIGCSYETARTHLKRGKKALATQLGQEDADA
jgi:RNA polymerase sigma factor (sigma-70 family)